MSLLAAVVMSLVCVGCTTSPMMPEIQHVVDGDGDAPAAEGSTAGRKRETPVRRTDTTGTTRNPFAITTKGQEIERSLGVDR